MKDNPLDAEVKAMAEALAESIDEDARASDPVKPFDSVKLSDEEEMHLYEYPSGFYPKEPMTNAEAAKRLLTEWGPERYVDWADRMEPKRRARLVPPAE